MLFLFLLPPCSNSNFSVNSKTIPHVFFRSSTLRLLLMMLNQLGRASIYSFVSILMQTSTFILFLISCGSPLLSFADGFALNSIVWSPLLCPSRFENLLHIDSYFNWLATSLCTSPTALNAMNYIRAYSCVITSTLNSVWAYPRELKQLTHKIIDAFLSEPSKKQGKLKYGYEIARDPTAWEAEQAEKDARANEPEEEEEEVADDVDMLAEDGEGASAGKKRKRASEGKPANAKQPKKKETASKGKKEPPAKKQKVCMPCYCIFHWIGVSPPPAHLRSALWCLFRAAAGWTFLPATQLLHP